MYIIYMAILQDLEISNFFATNSLTDSPLQDLEELSLLKND